MSVFEREKYFLKLEYYHCFFHFYRNILKGFCHYFEQFLIDVEKCIHNYKNWFSKINILCIIS